MGKHFYFVCDSYFSMSVFPLPFCDVSKCTCANDVMYYSFVLFRPKDVNKVVLRPGNVHHHHDTVESQLSKDKDTVGRESTFADDESEDLDGNDLSQHRMSSDTALMPPHHGHFEHDRQVYLQSSVTCFLNNVVLAYY
jgi:hypothetical protein